MKALAALFLTAALLTGCAAAPGADAASESAPSASPALPDFAVNAEEQFSSRDLDTGWDADAVSIQLNGSSASGGGSGVEISGGSVTLRQAGTYLFSGSLENGSITVDAGQEDKLHLVFSGVSVHSESAAALLIRQADKVVVTLAEGTENRLSNGGSFADPAESKLDAAVFSRADLSFNGSGSLSVVSPAGHGIACKDDLVLAGGSYAIEAAGHGLEANDSVRLRNAQLDIRAGKDGVHAENDEDAALGYVLVSGGDLTVRAQGDGLSAGAFLQLDSGSFAIVSGGGNENAAPHASGFGPFRGWDSESAAETESVSGKALKAGSGLLVSGGSYTLDAADDALHSDASLCVTGGSFAITTGDDGLHADETLSVSGGSLQISACYEGLEALELLISGGEIDVTAADDGLNAAGGRDQSGFGGPRGGDGFGRPRSGGGFGEPGRGGGGFPAAEEDSGARIVISGGTVRLTASGDGLDSNGSLLISGGSVSVCGPSQGDTSVLDYETEGRITGGVFAGTGGTSMAQSFSGSLQGVLAVSTGPQAAGTPVSLAGPEGTLFSLEPALPYALVIFSSPELLSGESYTLTVGSQSEAFTAS